MLFMKYVKDYHFKLLNILILVVLCAQSCLTLCNPMDCHLPGFSVLGIFQTRILEWVAIPSPVSVNSVQSMEFCRQEY